MKLLLVTILIFAFGCCTTNKLAVQNTIIESKQVDTSRDLNTYYVKSIYLMDSSYIIHVSRNDSLFKIFSPLVEPLFLPPWLKKDRQPCERLQEGKLYELEIHSISEVPNIKTSPPTFWRQRRGGHHIA